MLKFANGLKRKIIIQNKYIYFIKLIYWRIENEVDRYTSTLFFKNVEEH